MVRLLGLLLVDAMRTVAVGRRGEVDVRETRAWICAGATRRRYSFDDACVAYGLPPGALRRRLGLRAQAPRRASGRGWMRGPSA